MMWRPACGCRSAGQIYLCILSGTASGVMVLKLSRFTAKITPACLRPVFGSLSGGLWTILYVSNICLHRTSIVECFVFVREIISGLWRSII